MAVTQDYIGSLTTENGSGGSLSFTVVNSVLNTATFYRFGQQVKTVPISFESDGNQMLLAFDYVMGGREMRARLDGTNQHNPNFDYFMGTYESTWLATKQVIERGSWDARLS